MDERFASRAGYKLEHALSVFNVKVSELVCADFGSSTGGFVDCLLQNGASKVYSVDTSYGELAWKLRQDPRVVVMERTNALHVELPEQVDFISIDTGWTAQRKILLAAKANLKIDGQIISLIKPHYEAPKEWLTKGGLDTLRLDDVLEIVRADIEAAGFSVKGLIESPITGKRRDNREFLAWVKVS